MQDNDNSVSDFDPRVFSQMQSGLPVATYKKTILGKVFVQVYDPFTHQPVGLLLEGEKGTEAELVDVWSEAEDLFFRRKNKKALDTGMVIKTSRSSEKETPKTIEQYSDDELRSVINVTHAAFLKTLSRVTSEAVLFRMMDLVVELEKSDKYTTSIKSKLAELQVKSAGLNINK